MSRKLIEKTELRPFSVRLQQVMEALKWSQATLAKESNVSTMSISKWITGKYPPSLASINKVAVATGCRADWLVKGDGDIWDPDVASPHRQDQDYVDRIVADVDEYIEQHNIRIAREKKGKIIKFLNRISSQVGFSRKNISELLDMMSG